MLKQADRPYIVADWNGICTIRATVVDGNGVACPAADNLESSSVVINGD